MHQQSSANYYETKFNNFLKSVNCQYSGCNRINKAYWFCYEPFFEYRFLCEECSKKFLLMGMVELDNFKELFLVDHVEKTNDKVIIFLSHIENKLKEIKDFCDSLRTKLVKTLNVRLENVLGKNQNEFMRYLKGSINFLSYKNKYQEELSQATFQFKLVVQNIQTIGEELGFARTQEINNNYDTYLEKSQELFTQKKYLESLKQCNDYLVIKPDEVTMQFRKAQCLTKLGKYNEAIKYLKIIEVNNNQLNVEKFDFNLYYGQCLYKLKKWNDALKKFKIALDQQQNKPELYLYVAKTLMKLNFLDEAESVFNKISKNDFVNDKINIILYYQFKAKLLIKTCKDQNDLNDVVEKLEDKLSQDTQNIEIMYTLGQINQYCLKYNEALRYFNDILIIQPNHYKSQQLILKIQRQKRLLQGNEKKSFSLCNCIINCFKRNTFQFIEL